MILSVIGLSILFASAAVLWRAAPQAGDMKEAFQVFAAVLLLTAVLFTSLVLIGMGMEEALR